MHTKFGDIASDNYLILETLFYGNPEEWNCGIFSRVFCLGHKSFLLHIYWFVACDFNTETSFFMLFIINHISTSAVRRTVDYKLRNFDLMFGLINFNCNYSCCIRML